MNPPYRPANLIDALRILGAICVVWYHNPLYWGAGDARPSIDAFKFIVSGWAMPFFYVTTAWFSLQRPPKVLLLRAAKIAAILVVYTALYEAFAFQGSAEYVGGCIPASTCSVWWLFDKIRMGNGTPVYFLADVISICLVSAALSLAPRWKLAALALSAILAVVVSSGETRVFGLFLNPLAGGCLAAALFAKALMPSDIRPFHVGPISFCLIITGFILIWGGLNLWFAQNAYWSAGPVSLLFAAMLILLLYAAAVIQPAGSVPASLSRAGQTYALGVFLFHQMTFNIISSRVAALDLSGFWIFFINGIAATVFTICVVYFVRRTLPWLVSL